MKFFQYGGNSHFYSSFLKKAFSPVDNSSLIAFRIIFGLLLCFHIVSALFSGYVYEAFIRPPFTFNFIGFNFLQPLPGPGMYFYFGLMALLALMIALGSWYHIATAGFTILYWGIYLMQKTNYNNHYYLILLLSFLMVFIPANRYCSVDVKRKAVVEKLNCPQWISWLFISQVAIVYFFAALAKFNPDWLSGRFIKIVFSQPGAYPLIGLIYRNSLFQLMICYGGVLFDLFIVPLLLWKKTQRTAILIYCVFHVFNSFTFRIGIFPYLSIAFILFFIDPVKVRRFLFPNKPDVISATDYRALKSRKNLWVIYGVGVYLLIQLIIPMRSWFYPGNAFWTEEGHRMSWKMMVRSKKANIHFKIIDRPTGKVWIDDPATKFSPRQAVFIAAFPDVTWQYVQYIKKDFAAKGFVGVEVYAIGKVSLNGGAAQPLIDSLINLAAVKWHPFKHSNWILPLKEE